MSASVTPVVDDDVECTEDVLDVVGGALRVVERTVVVRVGGADVRGVPPRNDEE